MNDFDAFFRGKPNKHSPNYSSPNSPHHKISKNALLSLSHDRVSEEKNFHFELPLALPRYENATTTARVHSQRRIRGFSRSLPHQPPQCSHRLRPGPPRTTPLFTPPKNPPSSSHTEVNKHSKRHSRAINYSHQKCRNGDRVWLTWLLARFSSCCGGPRWLHVSGDRMCEGPPESRWAYVMAMDGRPPPHSLNCIDTLRGIQHEFSALVSSQPPHPARSPLCPALASRPPSTDHVHSSRAASISRNFTEWCQSLSCGGWTKNLPEGTNRRSDR